MVAEVFLNSRCKERLHRVHNFIAEDYLKGGEGVDGPTLLVNENFV